ncbi:MAG: PDZ domain-containing protein [Terriglobales bacterium]
MRRFAPSVALLLAGCASGYGQFYQSTPGATPEVIAANRAAPPPKSPQLEHAGGANGQAVVDAYLRQGYALIGYSSFNSGHRESESNAVAQGERVGADIVVVIDPHYTGSVTTSVPLTTPTSQTSYTTGTATAYGSAGTATAYGNSTTTTYGTQTTYIPVTVNRFDYGALYFVKRHIVFGANIRDLSDDERRTLQSNRGVYVMSVVDGSPAYRGDVLPGDILMAFAGQSIFGVKGETDLALQYKGQRIDITLLRGGQTISKSVQLAP